MKRTIALLLMITLVLAPAVGADAGESFETRLGLTYTPSAGYASSVYYRNIRELALTGNQRLDIVNAALTQVGYHEGDSAAELGGGNASGSRNYSEYGYWFGKYVLGNSGGFFYDWCAMFVSWCARQVRIPESIINNATYAHAGSGGYYFHVTYHARGTYSPKPGDLVFYDWANTDRQWDHVGILAFIENGVMHVAEGNADDSVRIRVISASHPEVQGFGVPAYTSADASAFELSSYPVPVRALRQGHTGEDVKWLQAALLHLGYASPTDGSFGANTARLLKQFQTAHGMTADGVCGPATRSALLSALGLGEGPTVPTVPDDPSDPSNYPVPTRTLRKGMSGDDVKWLQAALSRLGFPTAIDGDFGGGTKSRVMSFQSSHGLSADGVVGPATRAAMISALGGGDTGGGTGIGYPEPTRVLRRGMKGDDVKWLQTALTRIGYQTAADGVFGRGTEINVKAFQRDAGLSADGIVGPATLRALKERL